VIRKLTLAAGFAAGYVLGAKAGEQRYRQIESKFRELAGMPAVQDLTTTLADTAGQIGDKAKEAVNDKVSAVGDKVTGNDVVDLGSSSSKSKTGARTASAPMAGAAASATAPDVP
jgi:hypothetical protein